MVLLATDSAVAQGYGETSFTDCTEEYSHEFDVDGLESFGIISHGFHRLTRLRLRLRRGRHGFFILAGIVVHLR